MLSLINEIQKRDRTKVKEGTRRTDKGKEKNNKERPIGSAERVRRDKEKSAAERVNIPRDRGRGDGGLASGGWAAENISVHIQRF